MPLLLRTGMIPDRPLYWHFPIYLEAYFEGGPFETGDEKFRTRPGSAIRLGKWKLLEFSEENDAELYDLEADIGEKCNLVRVNPEIAANLRAQLQSGRKQIRAPVPVKLNPDYLPGS